MNPQPPTSEASWVNNIRGTAQVRISPADSGPSRVLTSTQRFERGRDEVFAFFAAAENLEQLTPAWLRFRILTPRPIAMHDGALIDYTIRLRGVPIRWRTRIAAWDPPRRFVDEQVRGPYAFWRHEHVFEQDGDGTVMTDRVEYTVPLGTTWAGRAIDRLLVRPDVTRIFEYRHEAMAALFARSLPSAP